MSKNETLEQENGKLSQAGIGAVRLFYLSSRSSAGGHHEECEEGETMARIQKHGARNAAALLCDDDDPLIEQYIRKLVHQIEGS